MIIDESYKEASRLTTKRMGRLVYIDPNDLASLNDYTDKNIKDNVYWKPEDLSIGVDLQVIVPNRSDAGTINYDDQKFIVTLTTEKDIKNNVWTSFLNGEELKDGQEEKYLTDSFTDISYTEIKKRKESNKECLGIKSIDITFDTSFYPQVSINFTDVRGYSLMNPAEESDNKEGKERAFTNFFKSLFHFPYPRFMLTVKGFYGTKVTFMLAVNEFKTSFDSSTGNFDVTVTFIGYMYGIYTDIPFNFLLVAPYIDNINNEVKNTEEEDSDEDVTTPPRIEKGHGRYWEEKKGDGTFKTKEGDDLPTFVEYINKYYEMKQEIEKQKETLCNTNEYCAEDNNCRKDITILGQLKDGVWNAICSYCNPNENGGKRGCLTDDKNNIIDEGSKGNGVSGIIRIWRFDELDDYDNIENAYESCISKAKELSTDGKSVPEEWTLPMDGEWDDVEFDEAETPLKANKSVYTHVATFEVGDYFNRINSKINELNETIAKLQPEVLDAEKDLMKSLMGFAPHIENIFRMIFAHLDTFLHFFYEGVINVIGQNRPISDFPGFTLDDCDLSKEGNPLYLPPFPAIYTEKNESNGGGKRRTLIYPPDFGDGNIFTSDKLVEIQFVENILSASIQLHDEIHVPKEEKKEEDDDEDDENNEKSDAELKEETRITSLAEVATADKLSCYNSLKMMFDKWLTTYQYEQFKMPSPAERIETLKKRYCMDDGKCDDRREFNNFLFVDSFYNDISSDLYIDVNKFFKQLTDHISSKSNQSVYEFMAQTAQDNKLLMIALPLYSNYYDTDTLVRMFSPSSAYDPTKAYDIGIGNTYLLIYTHEPSHQLTDNPDSEYESDGFDLNDKEPLNLFGLDESQENDKLQVRVPSFAVSFGKQNQEYFKGVNVNMDNPKVTDYSIANQFQLANVSQDGSTYEPNTIGQNIFSIYSNRSYNCSVEMMGCANIMPMMYFQLNNIPMFRGAYMITNVEHHIESGNMTTTFTGTRMSKNYIPFNKKDAVLNNSAYNGSGYGSSGEGGGYNYTSSCSGTWMDVVREVGTWYMNNVHTYYSSKNTKMYKAPILDNATVRPDCSGFVSACLQKFGVLPKGATYSSFDFSRTTSSLAKKLTANGWTSIKFSYLILQPGDIYVIYVNGGHHHVGIFDSGNGNSWKCWCWGNVHDGRNGHPGMPCSDSRYNYQLIWRPPVGARCTGSTDESLDSSDLCAPPSDGDKNNAGDANNRCKLIVEKLKSMGMSQETAIGCAASLWGESPKWIPSYSAQSNAAPTSPDFKGGYGIMQWSGKPYLTGKVGLLTLHPNDYNQLSTQLDYIKFAYDKIDGFAVEFDKVRKYKDAKGACEAWSVYMQGRTNNEGKSRQRYIPNVRAALGGTFERTTVVKTNNSERAMEQNTDPEKYYILVDKKTSTLKVMYANRTGNDIPTKTYNCILSVIKGQTIYATDYCTPQGTFKLGANDTSKKGKAIKNKVFSKMSNYYGDYYYPFSGGRADGKNVGIHGCSDDILEKCISAVGYKKLFKDTELKKKFSDFVDMDIRKTIRLNSRASENSESFMRAYGICTNGGIKLKNSDMEELSYYLCEGMKVEITPDE